MVVEVTADGFITFTKQSMYLSYISYKLRDNLDTDTIIITRTSETMGHTSVVELWVQPTQKMHNK